MILRAVPAVLARTSTPLVIRHSRSYAAPVYNSSATLKPPNPTKALSYYPPPDPEIPLSKPYYVQRTKTNNLPVYSLAKSEGRTLRLTRIRKVTGDLNALKKELCEHLELDDEDVTINHLTQHVHIKGWKRLEVCEFLSSRNF